MKKKVCLIIALFFSLLLFSQSNNWKVIRDNEIGVIFSVPNNVLKFDSLHTSLYGATIDSTEAIQVHIFRKAKISNHDPVFNEALRQEKNDTLRAIAKIMLLITDSDLMKLKEVNTNEVKGLEIGIKYNSLQANETYYTFTRYYLRKEKFISFTWTAVDTKLTNMTTKEYFFNSINFY